MSSLQLMEKTARAKIALFARRDRKNHWFVLSVDKEIK